jgi:tungstate transport system ATP-binding protein
VIPALAVADILVARAGQAVLDVPALAVAPGEILAVIGPNGAGKSTLLRVGALLEKPRRGTVALGGVVPHGARARLAARRRMAAVFSTPSLARGSVARNARLALGFRGISRADADRRARPWLERLGITHLADRSAATLSGGEAQRASLARALAADPEVLFLDEPFASLDPGTRDALVDDLGPLLRRGGTTTVMVTHDRSEALRLGDRVAVLLDGRLAQVGPPEAVFGAPADEGVARFVGVENLLGGSVIEARDGLVRVAVATRVVTVIGDAQPGERVLVGVRPEDVTLEPGGAAGVSSAQNRFDARVIAVTALGPLQRVVLDGGVVLTALVTRPAVAALGLAGGEGVTATFKATAAHLIRRPGTN